MREEGGKGEGERRGKLYEREGYTEKTGEKKEDEIDVVV